MDSKRAGGVAIFGIITLALIWCLLSFMPQIATSPIAGVKTDGQGAEAAASNAPAGPRVEITHSSANEMHTYAGYIETPTPCHTLDTAASAVYSVVPELTLSLTVTPPASDAMCAQVVTKQEFSTSVSSKVAPKLLVTIDGALAQVALTEK